MFLYNVSSCRDPSHVKSIKVCTIVCITILSVSMVKSTDLEIYRECLMHGYIIIMTRT